MRDDDWLIAAVLLSRPGAEDRFIREVLTVLGIGALIALGLILCVALLWLGIQYPIVWYVLSASTIGLVYRNCRREEKRRNKRREAEIADARRWNQERNGQERENDEMFDAALSEAANGTTA